MGLREHLHASSITQMCKICSPHTRVHVQLCSRLTIANAQLEAMAMPLVDILLNQAELAVLEELRVAKKQLSELTTKASRVRGPGVIV